MYQTLKWDYTRLTKVPTQSSQINTQIHPIIENCITHTHKLCSTTQLCSSSQNCVACVFIDCNYKQNSFWSLEICVRVASCKFLS